MPQTPQDVRRLDHNAVHLGVETWTLMQNAGAAVAEETDLLLGKRGRHVLVLAGPGNNGGDGLVAAQVLSADHEVRVVLTRAASGTPEAGLARQGIDERRVHVRVHEDPARLAEDVAWADVVIDALLGIGLHGNVREPVATIIRALNGAKRPVLSVDVPSGLGGDLAVKPRVTVALHDRKQGSTKANSGVIHIRDIGVPAEAETRCGPGDLIGWWRPNAASSRKGDNGRLLIVGGGPYHGAPMLASRAALRAGIDLVRLYTPATTAAAARANMPDLIVHEGLSPHEIGSEDVDVITAMLPNVDALLIGPGLGKSRATGEAVRGILGASRTQAVPVAVDADAIGLSKGTRDLGGRPSLVTPHAGEFRAFSGRKVPKSNDAAWRLLDEVASRASTTVLLKGPVDRISGGKRRRENHVHTPAMTRGGTGDVLAGTAAAFLARGASPMDAAAAAAFVVGDAALALAADKGHGLLASEVADTVAIRMAHWLRLDARLENL